MDETKAREMMHRKTVSIEDLAVLAEDAFRGGFIKTARQHLLNMLDLTTDAIRLTMRAEAFYENEDECGRCGAELYGSSDTCPECVFEKVIQP